MKRVLCSLRHTLVLTLALGFLSACSGSDSQETYTTNSSENTLSSSVRLTGTVQSDPADPSSSGKNVNASVYVIGQENNVVKTDSNGNFNLSVKTSISGTILSKPSRHSMAAGAQQYGLIVISEGDTHGRKVEVDIVEGQANAAGTIYVKKVGIINGFAMLEGAADHSFIFVGIPGTPYLTTTRSDGYFELLNIPPGTYDVVRAEKSGTVYSYAAVTDVVVLPDSITALDMLLRLSTGPNGSVEINGGDDYTTSEYVELSMSTVQNAVLMMISEDPAFIGATWEPFQSTRPFLFTGDYSGGGDWATVYARFAEMSGLETAPVSDDIYIDTNPQVVLNSPASQEKTDNTTPHFEWAPVQDAAAYRFLLSASPDLSGPFVVNTTIADTFYSPTTPLPNTANQVYYWGVEALNPDSSVKVSSVTRWFTLDTTDPSISVFVINNDDTNTTQKDVYVDIAASDATGVTGYLLTEDTDTPSLTDAGWVKVTERIDYSALDVPFTLTGGSGTNTLYLWLRDGAGNLSTASDDITMSDFIYELVDNLTSGINNPDAVINSSGAIHVAYLDKTFQNIKYANNETGIWQKGAVGTGGPYAEPCIKLAPDGTPHILYIDTGQTVKSLIHARRAPGESAWTLTSLADVASGAAYPGYDMEADSDGMLHIAFSNANGIMYDDFYITNAPDGTWKSPVLIRSGTYAYQYSSTLDLEIDSANTIHIMISLSSTVGYHSYWKKESGGVWTEAYSSTVKGADGDMEIDSTGYVHLLGTAGDGSTYYLTNTSGYFIPDAVAAAGTGTRKSLEIGPSGTVHGAYGIGTSINYGTLGESWQFSLMPSVFTIGSDTYSWLTQPDLVVDDSGAPHILSTCVIDKTYNNEYHLCHITTP